MKYRLIMYAAALVIGMSSCQKGKDLPKATPVKIILADGAKLQSNDLANHSPNQLYFDLRNDLSRFLENNNCYIVNDNPQYIVEITKITDVKTREIKWFNDPCGPWTPSGLNRQVVLDGYYYAAEVNLYDANYNLMNTFYDMRSANEAIANVGLDINGCLDVNVTGTPGGYGIFRTTVGRALREDLTTAMYYHMAPPPQ